MMSGADLVSPDVYPAQISRADIEAAIAAAGDKPPDLTGKRFSAQDLSGLDLRGAIRQAAP